MHLFHIYIHYFYFLVDSMPVLNAKNDLNELIFFLKGVLENGDSHDDAEL